MAKEDEPGRRAAPDRRLSVKLVQAAMLGLVAYAVVARRRRVGPASVTETPAASTVLAHVIAEPSGNHGPRETANSARSWLLGDGRWLTIAAGAVLLVLLLCFILPAAPPRRMPAPPPPPLRAAPARQDVPPGGQEPIGEDEVNWINADDYPPEAIAAEETGKVLIRWQVTAEGVVTNCGVVTSSGHSRLDHAACDAIVRHGSYRPARDAAGWPIAVTRERRVVWQLPD